MSAYGDPVVVRVAGPLSGQRGSVDGDLVTNVSLPGLIPTAPS
jgi:hypothetical protein